MHEHLRRLVRVWTEQPIYFITTCTYRRKPILTLPQNADILASEWQSARERHGWAVGRFVIMPDHVHFFCAPEHDAKTLSDFVGAWKRWTSRRINDLSATPIRELYRSRGQRPRLQVQVPARAPVWQREFFDHVLRSSESYSEKWNYVRENPVRAGLVVAADEWALAGEIEELRM